MAAERAPPRMAAAVSSSSAARSLSNAPRASVLQRFEAPEVDVVSCHALTPDGGLLALCPNTEEVLVLQFVAGTFRQLQVLAKHTQRVTGLSWSCPEGGAGDVLRSRLVSCSEDRTAYVWHHDAGAGLWRGAFVELAAPRAALCAVWAPNGERFAVGLASKETAICYYRAASQCWVAVKVGKSKASVRSVAWHPTSQYLATGSTDGRCVVHDVTEEHMLPEPRPPFGEVQVSDDAGAWVNAVMFSPTGRFIAFLAHDSTLRVKDLSGGPDAPVAVVRWKGLPFLGGAFLTDKCVVACGFDCVPVVFRPKWSSSQWEVSGTLDVRPPVEKPLPAAGSRDSFAEARSKFGGGGSSAAAQGRQAESAPGSSCHTSTITACAPLGAGVDTARFSTSGLDGQVLVWELTS